MGHITTFNFRTTSVLSNITPFAYSDNITFLEKLEFLRKKIADMIKEYNACIDVINQWNDAIREYIAEVDAENDDNLAKYKDEVSLEFADVRQAISELNLVSENGGISFDPTNGTRSETVSYALSRTYDYVRVYGMFASDYDMLNRTAEDIDALEENAREFDLHGAKKLNVNMGDYFKE